MLQGRTLKAMLALAALTQLAACGDDDATDKFTGDPSPSVVGDGGAQSLDFGSFDRALQAAIDEHNRSADAGLQIRGASAVVVDRERGVVHRQGYGEYSADRRYLIASASKILSVGVLMRLADQGKLDIDAPISQYLSDWGPRQPDLTIAQLVSNSSGLPSLFDITALAEMNPPNPQALARLLPHLCQYNTPGIPPLSLTNCGRSIYTDANPENRLPPDTRFAYGGSQWQLAGAVAEKVSGKSWAELVRETYVEPCGVETLGYTNQFGTSALGYPADFNGDVSRLPVTDNPSIEGGAYITAADYGTLLWMHMRGGTCGEQRVLSEQAVRRMQENRIQQVYAGNTGNPELPGYGLGWWVHKDGNVVADPGAYGAYPFIDRQREYAAMILIEVNSEVGSKLAWASKPALDAIFDAARQ